MARAVKLVLFENSQISHFLKGTHIVLESENCSQLSTLT
jgi:hypothetical protein